MPLQKETVTLNFSQGLDTIDDPNQVPLGKFTSLVNTVFIKSNTGEVGALKKRNGFQPLPATVSTVSYITNYNESLVGIGQGSIQQYSSNAQAWINQGYYQPVNLSVQSIVKNAYSQGQQDSQIASNGIGCVVYNLGDLNNTYKYTLFDSSSGQLVSQSAILPVISSTTATFGQAKVFNLGSSFFIVYGTQGSGISQLVATQVNNYAPFSVVQTKLISNSLYQLSRVDFVSSAFITSYGSMFDGTVASNNIVLSFVSASPNSMFGAKVSPSFTVSSAVFAIGSYDCSAISNCFDPKTSTVYTTIASATSVTYLATDYNFAQSFSPRSQTVGSGDVSFFATPLPYLISNLGTIASGGSMQSFVDFGGALAQLFFTPPSGTYPYRSNTILNIPVTSSGVIGSETIVAKGHGLASKPFFMNGGIYLFSANQDNFQPTYYLLNSTGFVQSQFAYGNGGGYYYCGIPSVSVYGNSVSVSYLRKDLLESQSIQTLSSSGTSQSNFISPFYSQTGINQGTFSFSTSSITARQTGNTLSVNGGFLWSYDGVQAVENNFFSFPVGPSCQIQGLIVSSSQMKIQNYQYQAIFESMDAQGNIYRSSTGFSSTIQQAGISSGSVVAQVAISLSTPRLSYKIPSNPIKTSIYRWSDSQQIFYKVGSFIYNGSVSISSITQTFTITAASARAFDSVQIFDTTPDYLISGNEILYTNGNVIEDSPAPSFISMDVWDERLWGISAEDNTLWFSKPIVANTPVEMNGNFSLFVPPVQTSQGTSQKPLCLAPMDEKQIVFCKSSILYIAGSGPDITGANSQYSEPTQIPSQVGCSNPNSIVQTPNGIMFQSDNGIWLLGRDLSVRFVGKEVEAYNNIPITSAVCVPGTSEVRFSLNNGIRLVYDLLVDQWTSFTGVNAQSSTIVQGLDTVVTPTGQLLQETQNNYSDISTPVTMSFTTGWINLSNLQGYQRAYWMDILGTFQSPHAYSIGIAYDYNPAIVQTSTINPYNVVGSGSMVEQWQVGFQREQCQSFQLTFTEISSGTAGAGLTISGISLTYGRKKTFARNIPPRNKI